jgi:hypothetical protein
MAPTLRDRDWEHAAQLAAAGERVVLSELDERLVDLRL